jgi:chromosome segregation protein
MLKALELVGFKSFADRTRFDFPDGITVVVGPNGSGKSNVVDAVKWVLGAQSAKALRGADMADVIFKGSAEGGRKPANSAEVILILDNKTRVFSHDADEVHVSRRVFRSGEGEYAINSQPCRLKDVKDLFRGTGVGVDAYSLIEQGKVDRLLQASAKDRRGIFEEAAGISRFKAKKVEAERRLVRVDQNMLRLSDIVDEIGKRLTSLKGQAARANRYREMTVALQTKRQQLGWLDRIALTKQQQDANHSLAVAQNAELDLQTRYQTLQESAAEEQRKWQHLQSSQEIVQNQYLEAQRERISATSGHSSAVERHAELTAEQEVLRDRIKMLQHRATMSTEEIQQKQQELAAIDLERQSAIVHLDESEKRWSQLQESLNGLKQKLEETKNQQAQVREDTATARSEITAYRMHIEQFEQSIVQHQALLADASKELEQLTMDVKSAEEKLSEAMKSSELVNAEKKEAEDRLQVNRLAVTNAQEKLIALQGKSHGVRERLKVLSQLEEQYTGAGRGGQQLLRLARENRHSQSDPSQATNSIVSNVWDTVQGVVADLLTTEMHLAPLIDVALGAHSDAIVLSNGQIIDWINDGNYAIDGRVTLIRMDRLSSRRSGEKIQLDGLRGVLGRADRMTQFPDPYEPLIRFLLGTTWFVDTLTTALELSHFRGAGLRFVTAECQLVESDGSITLGSLQTGLGLVSRRSEMQVAREEIQQLQDSISAGVALVANAQAAIVDSENRLRDKDLAAHQVAKELTTCELRLESALQRRAKLAGSLSLHEQNCATSELRLAEAHDRILNAEQSLDELSAQALQIEQIYEAVFREHAQNESAMQSEQSIVTDRRIQLARIEQRLVGLRITLEQLQQDTNERIKSVAQSEESLVLISTRIASTLSAIADFESKAKEAGDTIQRIEAEREAISVQIQSQNEVFQSAQRECESARRSLEKAKDRIEAIQSQLQQWTVQWTTLHEHYVQEYQVELNEIGEMVAPFLSDANDPSIDDSKLELLTTLPELRWFVELLERSPLKSKPAEVDRAAIESEIAHLRHEIAASGGVNMEALQELDELQSRFDKLSTHYQDLSEAKSSLVKTMNKIDQDSQELFLTTLNTIRINFQDLYRRSFGGGFADIVLEDERDPESGIEIIATPPGKTTLSNSLLSGGEKALTAVALIMAFFQYRPSPFCILDEVDAPFDEANIGRFVTVLREFLDTTKFIVVTHSKKTMTAANMIYGITMQESGVSRQVSVRFEEVGDKGEIINERRAA